MTSPCATSSGKSPDRTVFPHIRTIGTDGLLVSFADALSEPANRAALAFRAAIEAADLPGLLETSASLVSAYLRFDISVSDHGAVSSALETLLRRQNWLAAPLPGGRRRWSIPTVYGTELAPQLEEAAAVAGLTPEEAIASISNARVRVQTIGFAPGMPYLGELPPEWAIPRQTQLTGRVPVGGLCVAIRQLVLFPVDTPTGWRHIGQTAFSLFRPDDAAPFALRPGDEARFVPVTAEALANMRSVPDGGATFEVLR
ncbi:allophanate hydrolase [Rhodobacteraceae bacterium (ex Bugula neritina AB1)]|nr:allophanate hydrolase [Rhodobacteraceae bacterium (ex Bugula neritina AB1)]